MAAVEWEYSNVKLYSQAELDAAIHHERERCMRIAEALVRLLEPVPPDPDPKYNTPAAAFALAQVLATAAVDAIREPSAD